MIHCQPRPYFIEKIIQFYEGHIVRHSVVLVGMPFSGKRTALKTLQNARSDLARDQILHPDRIVRQARLNPKSIPANCLYGRFDEVSHEWADGLVAVLFRGVGRNHTEERRGLVFDGPIKKVTVSMIDSYAIFSIIWSIGSVLATASRPSFGACFKSMLQGKEEGIAAFKRLSPEFQERGSVFDWVFVPEKVGWSGRMDTVEPQQIKPGTQLESFVGQTTDNVRYRYGLNHSIRHRTKVIVCGPTGTGKTAYMQQVLVDRDKDKHMQILLGFSAQTKCAQTPDRIDAKLDRRRKEAYGPPSGSGASR